MHTCVRLDSLPESVRDEALRLGRQLGVRVEIDTSVIAALTRHKSVAFPVVSQFGTVRMRTDFERETILTICEPCDKNKDGRCRLCRVCGGLRLIADWVKLSSHHCPDKKW